VFSAAPRIGLVLLPVLLASCASVPEDRASAAAEYEELLASTPLYKRGPPETAPVIEVARFSQLSLGAMPERWEPWKPLPANTLTTYKPARIGGETCMNADATEGNSALRRVIRISPQRQPVVEWRWRVPRLASDSRVSKPTPRARLMLAFHGDASRLDFEQRTQLRFAKAMTGGEGLPYSSLMYVWINGVPEGTVVQSPYTERVRLIAVDSDPRLFDTWIDLRRNVREDYRRVFGEDPGDIVAVGIFTDVDSNGAPGHACYGDITFRSQ
jgi:hypothetical protein